MLAVGHSCTSEGEAQQMQTKYNPTRHKQTNNECPHCGWEITGTHTFEQVLSGQFDNVNNGDFNAVRITPLRPSNLQSDVLVPAAQSLIWSLCTLLPSTILAMWLRWEWYAPLFVGATTILASWISAMKKSDLSLSKTEEFSYSANEFDARKITPDGETDGIELEIIHRGGGIIGRMQRMNLPSSVSVVDFIEFSKSAIGGKSLARREWAGKGKIFSRDGYDQLIAVLMNGGIIKDNPSGGKQLSMSGKHSLTAMLHEAEKEQNLA